MATPNIIRAGERGAGEVPPPWVAEGKPKLELLEKRGRVGHSHERNEG